MTHLFILLKDQPLPLRVDGGQRQREVSLSHIVASLQQTEMLAHTTSVKVHFDILVLPLLPHPGPLLPAFPLLHDHPCHLVDALSPVVLVVRLLRYLLQVLHVRPHQHVPQQQEVRVERVLHLQVQPELCVSGEENDLAGSLCGVIERKSNSRGGREATFSGAIKGPI